MFSLFFSAARGQAVRPILTSDTSKCMYLGELHSFWGQNNDVTISRSKLKKNT